MAIVNTNDVEGRYEEYFKIQLTAYKETDSQHYSEMADQQAAQCSAKIPF